MSAPPHFATGKASRSKKGLNTKRKLNKIKLAALRAQWAMKEDRRGDRDAANA